ncbi:hypothetical protein [Photorhabdus sp. RM71S]|uniref:hypothetical protein n=1 Tax=Photorhabdus sp. RM71S TaxID=3342824 RepID=UPI0036D9BFA8
MFELDLKKTVAGEQIAPTNQSQLDAHAQSLGCECEYCGYPSGENTALWRDGNPLNNGDENLTVVDPFCRAWRELDTLNADNAVMVMLPGLSPEDVSHFQRTLHVALACEDSAMRDDARKLLDWLTEHKVLTESVFGTSHPGAFSQALHRTPPEQRPDIRITWQSIAPVLNPSRLPSLKDKTQLESTPVWWPLMYQHYLTQR